jgi:phosphodiesterase/alkaline phosphatase D-like protein
MTRLGVIAVLTAGTLAIPCAPAQQDQHSKNQVRIISGPQLESATDRSAIVRWTTNISTSTIENSTVQYGTDPKNLNLTAQSPNRWNQSLPYMVHRVYLSNLQPGTTYYFRIAKKSDRPPVHGGTGLAKFTTATQGTYVLSHR